MFKPVLLHVGGDYATILINSNEHEINLSLLRDLYYGNSLNLSDQIDGEELKKFIKTI